MKKDIFENLEDDIYDSLSGFIFVFIVSSFVITLLLN